MPYHEEQASTPQPQRWADTMVDRIEKQCGILKEVRHSVVGFLGRARGEEPSPIANDTGEPKVTGHSGAMGSIESIADSLEAHVAELMHEVDKLNQIL